MDDLTLQGILKQHLPRLLESGNFPLYQLKALRSLSNCRTSALGGHTQYCSNGHVNGIWYNSCKHRACPQCQKLQNENWLRKTQSLLLNCPHHHVIFTMPEALNDLWRFNREVMSQIFFKAVQETLGQFSKDPRYLAATPGQLLVLHTWGRSLSLHPHIHCLISHGGMNTQGEWVIPKKPELFPQKPVMMVFRGKLLSMIRASLKKDEMIVPAGCLMPEVRILLNKQQRKDWVVHFCERYDHAEGVAKYLASYVKGGPIANSQLSSNSETQVTFKYQSHQTKKREKLTLSHEAFIQRLVQHIPLPRKQTARYSGLYGAASREKLNKVRALLKQKPVKVEEKLQWSEYLKEKGFQPVCSTCGLPIHHGSATIRLKTIH